MVFLFLLVMLSALAAATNTAAEAGVQHARPVLTALHPSKGLTKGGIRVEVYGRQLAYLDSDITAFMGDNICKDPKVLVGWEKFSVDIPPCPGCGRTLFNVMVFGQRSNFIEFLYTDECAGPTGDPYVEPIVPEHWSGRENCTVCTELVHLAVSSLRDNFKFQSLLDALPFACNSMHVRKYTTALGPQCQEDYNVPCRILVESRGPRLAGYIWDHWDEFYLTGRLPLWACREVQYCSPHIEAAPLPPDADD